jgi:protein-tyrosine phosphatase
MTKLKKLKQHLAAPAFNLEYIDDGDHEPCANAGECHEASEVLEWIFIGSWRDASNHDFLADKQITHVLNLAKENVPSSLLTEQTNLQHMTIPLSDSQSEDLRSHFDSAFKFIEEAQSAHGKVLVHCRRGISRSPAIVMGYLMARRAMRFADALAFVKEKRPCVSLNLAFHAALSEYTPDGECCGSEHGMSGASSQAHSCDEE